MPAAKYSHYYTYIKPVIENQLIKSFTPYIFSLITIMVMIIFAIKPTIATISNLQKEMQNSQDVLKALEKKSEDLTAGKNNWENLDPTIKLKINKALPHETSIAHLIQSLEESLGKSASISALQIQPVTIIDIEKRKKPTLNLGEISFSFNVIGSYYSLLTTLDNLNKTSRLINIQSITLSKQATGETVLSVSGKAYFLKP